MCKSNKRFPRLIFVEVKKLDGKIYYFAKDTLYGAASELSPGETMDIGVYELRGIQDVRSVLETSDVKSAKLSKLIAEEALKDIE